MVGLIYSDNRHTEWLRSALSKLNRLIAEIVNHAVYLFNHRLGQNLHFHANFNGCDFPSCDSIAFISNRRFTRNDFPKGTITSP